MLHLPLASRQLVMVGLLAPVIAAGALAQSIPAAPAPPEAPMSLLRPRPRVFLNGMALSSDRGYLGITPRASSGSADTLGLLIDDVDENLGAAKAGITRGTRLVSIDGLDLRLEPRDLGDPAAEALPESRLRRSLERKQPGDTVTLVTLLDGRKETRRVALSESPTARTLRGLTASGRRVLGVGFSERGSMRDTAGLLITSITTGGAADKAGLYEGDRLVSIDGIDLRVPTVDAGTADGARARVSRLRRALDAKSDSQPVRLDVLSDGRRRTLSVVPTRERGWSFSTRNMQDFDGDLRVNFPGNMTLSDDRDGLLRVHAEVGRALAESSREMARAQRDVERDMGRAQRDVTREMARVQGEVARLRDDDSDARIVRERIRDGEGRGTVRGTISGSTNGATLVLDGLTLAAVDRDFAERFGAGSQEGALVVRIRGDWEPLKVGDVILAVGSQRIRSGDRIEVSFDRGRDLPIEVIRNGRMELLTLRARR
jgi:hypothetical protein